MGTLVWSWIQQNEASLNTTSNVLMVFIWLAYLQLFLGSVLRQRRSVLHIDMGAATDEKARCLVSNMGSEPVYLVAIVVDIEIGDRHERAVVADRPEVAEDRVTRPLERTNKGPLASGEVRDLGSFWDLAERAHLKLNVGVPVDEITAITVTAVAASNQAHRMVGGFKRFSVTTDESIRTFEAEQVITQQLRTPWGRRRIRALINKKN